MSNTSKIPILNIYYMLSYAFKILKKQDYRKIETEHFENIYDLLAEILIKGIKIELKRGVKQDYIINQDKLSLIKGKIDFSQSVKDLTLIENKLICSFDVFSMNTPINQIIKLTFVELLKRKIDKNRKKEIRKILRHFLNVDLKKDYNVNWRINFNKSNQNYVLIISICNLIIKGLLQTQKDGNVKIADFIDEGRIALLFQNFILEYYKQEHKNIKTSSPTIKWQTDEKDVEFLPLMKSDVVLEYEDKMVIIDAKYYQDNMQRNYNTPKIRSEHLYQIFSYVKNKEIELNRQNDNRESKTKVSGMLLYAKTIAEIQPETIFTIKGNKIIVKYLDLDQEFSLIRKQLDEIAYDFCYEL